MAVLKGTKSVDATITILELRGVKCWYGKGNSVTRRIKRLSNKYGGYANVNDNAEVISGPNVKAVVSYRHTSEVDGSVTLDQVTSLPMCEESQDLQNKSLAMGVVWPTDIESSNQLKISKDIQQIQLPGKAEVPIPASVSLQVGIMLDGSETIQPIGLATVLISGCDQTVELCVPVRASQEKQKVSPTEFIRKGMSATPHCTFGATSLTMLKIKLDVVAKYYAINAVRASSSDEASSVISPSVSRDDNFKTRSLQSTKSQATLLRAHTTSAKSTKTKNTKSQISPFKTRAFVAFAARRLNLSKYKGGMSQHDLPELTVLSPSSGVNNSQTHEEATEIVLNASSAVDGATVNDMKSTTKISTDTSKSFDSNEESSGTRTTTVASKTSDNESTVCSVSTELNESVTKSYNSQSRQTQDTQSSSDKSSGSSFPDVVIASSTVTFEESKADESEPRSPQQMPSGGNREIFPADVTTQLEDIVRVYSTRGKKDKLIAPDASVFNDEDPVVQKDNKVTLAKKETKAEPTRFANIILKTFSGDTPSRGEQKTAQALGMIEETPQNETGVISQDVQSVILVHEDEFGARFDVEVSTGGDSDNVEQPSYARSYAKKNQQQATPSVNPSQISSRKSAQRMVNPVERFEQGYITVKHTMSSIDDLTVDSALDTIAAPSDISRSMKVAKNKRHPKRKGTAGCLPRATLCGTRCDLDEMIDDAKVGWKDIVVSDDILHVCDGIDYVSDDESMTLSLNTMQYTQEETVQSRLLE